MILSKALRAAAGNIAPAPPSTDPQFNYVSMLLHGDGTNGAQNNTFVDSSTNNFTITRNGNTTQGSLSPYGSQWSNWFSGSASWLNTPNNAALAMGTGDFTWECFVYLTQANSYGCIFDSRIGGTSGGFFVGYDAVPTTFMVYISSVVFSTTNVPTLNTWQHICLVRQGTTLSLFINGSRVGTATNSTNLSNGVINLFGNGNPAFGYLSNVRIVKGTAVYNPSNTTLTVPTTPLTAISGTSLLTCQSNRFIDNSPNNFVITVNGDVRVTKESPFLPTAAYSTSTIGGSGYFDGTGDYLTAPDNAAFDFGSGDFTVEMWLYPAALGQSGYTFIYLKPNASGYSGVAVLQDPSSYAVKLYSSSTGSSWDLANGATIGTLTPNAWNHVAVSRSGTNMRAFLNGALGSTTAVSTSSLFSTTNPVYIGSSLGNSNTFYTGHISNLRVVKGTAVYTSNFTPPTAPLTAITNTSLLLNFTNAGIFDNAAENDLETVGNAQISTSVKKYGTGSIAFDGTGDWLAPNDALPYTFGSGDFTVEFWLYLNSTQTAMLYDGRPVSGVGATPTIYVASNVLYYFTNNANRITGSTLSNTTWTHVALCKSGGNTRLFVNGTQVGSTYADSVTYTNTAGRPLIGASGETVGQFPLTGYIDDLRITKGYARYTANFTPPTAAFPDQ